jgi:diamine N-acetyltransferase
MKPAQVRLEPVTVENWKACIALELAPDQQDFLPSNLYSIAEAQFYAAAKSNAIYNLQGQLVGYALFGRDIFADKWKIFRIMIDKCYQGQGYGKSALQVIIVQISRELDGHEILISYQDDNQVARQLYAQLGFVEQQTNAEGQVTALLTLEAVARDK